MMITLPRHGRWLARCFLAVLFAGSAGTSAQSQDVAHKPDAVTRGQSPYVGGWNQSLPAESTAPFGVATSPWIVVSQETVAPPQSYSTSPYRMAQLPSDPFGQPYSGGAPGYGDPSLSGMYMDTPAIWQPYVAAQGKAGNNSSGAFGQLMMPLYQDGQSLFFADIRGRWDDSNNSEGNFGLAVRTLIDPTWFVGMYGFYDYRRTTYGNNFNQGTVGVEGMSVRYEARLNGYLPEAKAKAANSLSTAEFSGNTIFVKGGFERAYYGVDGEIGALLWDDGIGNHEFRGFVGGYWFDTNGKNFPSIAGPKGRLEFRSYDLPWFGPESRLTLGVELQNDNVREFQVSGIARLEIPLGFFQGARKLTRLERRMLDRIVRDDDIITVAQQGAQETGIDSLTNRLLNNVTFVDANTANIPLTVATAATPATSTVVADGHAGTITTNAPIALQAGQVFRGGGFKVIGSDTGAIATFGTRPTINNTNAAANTVVLANNSTVADLDLTGGNNGVVGVAALTGVLVSGNTVTGAASHGFSFNTLDAASLIQNNISQSNGNQGFFFSGAFSGTATGNVAAKNTQNGFGLASLLGTFQNNTAIENGRFGIGIDTSTATGKIIGNTANNNVQGGIAMFPGPVAGTITGNTANNNGRDAAGVIVNATADGFRFDGAITANISNNTAANNADRGFEFNGNLAATGKVAGNSATSNFNSGFVFNSTLDVGSEVSGNFSTRNGFGLTGAPVNANANGFEFANTISGVVSNNQASSNANNGFSGPVDANLNTAAAATFTNNIAINNGDFGYRAVLPPAGTVNNNTGSGNTNGGNTLP